MAVKNFRSGEVLFRPGDPSDCAYLLESGQVEILRGDDGQALRVALIGPGEVFGEMALVEERPHAMAARAVTDGSATSLTRAEFEHDLLNDPQRSRRYLRGLFERLRELTARANAVALPVADGHPAPATARVILYPLTRKAADSLPENGLVLNTLPFRIGRAPEPGELQPLDLNDLWLLDQEPFQVSRNHMSIDLWDGHQFIVRDRGSHFGTIVNEQLIGGPSRATVATLAVGDNVVIVGGRPSPYQFRVHVQAE
jgi:CRP/FNR family transcriptional regulator, cyclic AMP receptor protein